MTPRELACAIETLSDRRSDPLARDTFAALMERFPDGR
jgi:hypothetical protein